MSNHQSYINYNNYAQYYNAQAPPQPAWASPAPSTQPPQRSGWADPRASQQYGQQPNQTSAAGVSGYNPNQYGPMPTPSPAQAQNLQYAWGVRYQQQQTQQQTQQHEPKPPLPPRPTSAAGGFDTTVASYQSQTPTSWQDRQSDAQNVERWSAYNTNQHLQSTEPPPPPPRPAEYAWPQEHYASKPPSHHYEPSVNPNWTGQQATPPTAPRPTYGYNSGGDSQNQAIVSPVDQMSSSWTSGAGPSQVSVSNVPSYDQFHPVQTPLQGDANFVAHQPIQAATALAGPTSDWEYFAPESHPVSPEIEPSHPMDLRTPTITEVAKPVQAPIQHFHQNSSHGQTELQDPPRDGRVTIRQESASSHGSRQSPLQRTGTIDSVINAWNEPLHPRKDVLRNPSIVHSPSPSNSHGPDQMSLQEVGPPVPAPAPASAPQSFIGPTVEPFSDFEPQLQASLTRFISMLHKESAAESDAEKFKVFDSFLQKERRLRAVLYDIDLLPPSKDTVLRDSPRQPAKAPPVAGLKSEPAQNSSVTDISDTVPPTIDAQEKEDVSKEIPLSPKVVPQQFSEPPQSKDDSFVMVDREQGDEAVSYSPGGRPLISRPINIKTGMPIVPTVVTALANDPLRRISKHSPSDNAPQVVGEDYASTVPESPALAAPIVLVSSTTESSPQSGMRATVSGPLSLPVKFEPPRPVYTPFRYAEGHEVQPEILDTQRPPDQDYLAKRNSYDTSRLMHDVTVVPVGAAPGASPIAVKKVQEETFLGLIRSHSTVRPKPKVMDLPPSIRPNTTPPSARMRPDPIGDAVRALRDVLPAAIPDKVQSDKAIQIRQRMETFVDDFSFIRETVIPWDRDNREIRKKLDEERHRRQEESEIRLDELFNDNEIAYADLKGMEADFKLAEAERRYKEDKLELESFSKGVYEVVTARLQRQIDDLNKEYVLAVDLVDLESDSAARLLTSNGIRSSMSDGMDVVLKLFEKLSVRHHKLAEARFERERRRKRLELTVLYTNGDSEGTKTLEKEFSTAEKMQVLHEARDKDQRASKLMDTFERATVRGLGDNQAVVDELFAKVRRLNDVLPVDGSWQQNTAVYGENGARGGLATAQAVLDFVLTDSRALLAISNAADKTLNNADYAVSIAEAKAANADEATHSKLQADFAKEEAKLIEEMGMRLDSITKTPLNCASLVQEIITRIGEDGDHPDRMKKALEQAKMRNAGKET